MSLTVFSACENEQQEGILSADTLAVVYGDIMFARELYAGNPGKYQHALDSLLVSHGTDTTAVRDAFSFYANEPKELDKIYERAIERVEIHTTIDTTTVVVPAS